MITWFPLVHWFPLVSSMSIGLVKVRSISRSSDGGGGRPRASLLAALEALEILVWTKCQDHLYCYLACFLACAIGSVHFWVWGLLNTVSGLQAHTKGCEAMAVLFGGYFADRRRKFRSGGPPPFVEIVSIGKPQGDY